MRLAALDRWDGMMPSRFETSRRRFNDFAGSAGVVVAAAIVLAFIPLFQVLGFEFATAMGTVLTYVAGWRAAGRAGGARDPACPFPGRAWLRCTGENLLLAALPLIVMAINGVRVPNCNPSQGLAFYALLPLPGVIYGSAVGFCFGLAWPQRRARAVFLGWSMLTMAAALAWIVRHPPKFAFNTFIGYFPGPLYDAEIPITQALLVARGVVLIQAGLALALAVLLWDGSRARWRRLFHRWEGERAVAGAAAICLAGLWILVEVNAAALGVRLSRRDIQRALGGHLETAHCHL
jgi:hypothetical protein